VVTLDALAPGGARAVARCDLLGVAPYSDMEGGLYRGWLMPSFVAAQETIADWMREAGMQVRLDSATNLIGRYEGTIPGAPALLIGSHLDSVRDGGRYDGPLGIMLGIEAVAALNEAGERLPFPIEVYAFGDEEGSRFPAAMLTSRAVAGILDLLDIGIRDAEGISIEEAFEAFRTPIPVEWDGMDRAARPRGATLAYLEAHIEQGPVLEAEGLAVGTVTGIAAQLRYRVQVLGTAGHAGTSSMPLRRDALTGAAEMALAVETIAREDASDLVATVGKMEVLPGAANVIPGEVCFTIDVRSGDADRCNRAADAILETLANIAERRGLDFSADLIHDLPSSPCDPVLMGLMDAACADAGQPVRRLVSGAGHDAMVMAALCPTAMLFIRCGGGISHNPAETVTPEDADIALRVMLGFINRLGETI
jgi:allantoate deiminase